MKPSVLVAVLGILATPLGACGSSARTAASTVGHSSARGSHPSTITFAPRRLQVLATTSVPIDGPPLQAGFGAVWSASSHGLVRLSAATARPKVVLSSAIDDVVLAGGDVLALSKSDDTLIEFDPRLMKATRRWRLPGGAQSLVSSGHEIYVALGGPPIAIERIDLRNGSTRRARITPVSGLARDRPIAAGAGKLWVTDGRSLYWLEPATLAIVRSTSLGALDASDIWFGDGSLWAATENPNGGVERIDPATGRIGARDDADAIQITFSPHAVWLAAAAGPTAIDPVTAKREATLPTASVPTQGAGGIAVVGDQVWTVYTDIGKLQRVLARP